MTRHTLLFLSFSLAGCVVAQDTAPEAPLLTEIWKIENLAEPESVLALGDSTYVVSLVGGEGRDKVGNGTLAKISADGELLDGAWTTGLDAPKGIGMSGGNLYVSDVDRVAVVDAASGGLVRHIPVEGAGFLNDVLAMGDDVFVSDSANARIYVLRDGVPEVWLEDAQLGGVNGLWEEDGQMLVSTMSDGHLLRVDPQTREIALIATGMNNADGIMTVRDGGYVVSSWPGTLWRVSPEGEVSTLLDTTEVPILTNDIVRDGDLLLVANWRPGSVTAYRIAD